MKRRFSSVLELTRYLMDDNDFEFPKSDLVFLLLNTRIEAGISRKKMAKKLNISKRTLDAIEGGDDEFLGNTLTVNQLSDWFEACGKDLVINAQ